LKKPSFGQQSTLPQKKIFGFVGQAKRAVCLIDGVLETSFTRQKTRSRKSGVPMWIYHAVARDLNSLLDLIQQSPTVIRATLRKADSRQRVDQCVMVFTCGWQNGDSTFEIGDCFVKLSQQIENKSQISETRPPARGSARSFRKLDRVAPVAKGRSIVCLEHCDVRLSELNLSFNPSVRS